MSPSVRGGVVVAALATTIVVPLALSWAELARMPWAVSGTAALLAGGLVLRRNPPVALGLVTAAALLAATTDQGPWPYLGSIVLVFLAGRSGAAGRFAWLVLLGASAAFAVLSVAGWADPVALLLTLVGTVVLPWWIGSDAGVRASLRDAGWERAEQLEREQRFAVEAVRQQERARLAAEMHDALGYELSVLALTAGAGEVDPRNTEEQRAQFTRTREAAVRAVDSLHDVLRILREDETGREASPDAIAELVAKATESGASIDASLDVDPTRWPDAVRRGAHRIVQELLTNAAKHAPGSRVRLSLVEQDDRIVLRASNPRPARTPAQRGSGSGLAGIAERARVLGGAMTTSPQRGLFEVVVTLPLRPARPQPALGSRPDTPAAMASERRPRDRRWRTAVLPVLALAISGGLLLALNAATVQRIGLSSATFDGLRVGMPLEETDARLPPAHLDELPAAFRPERAPQGAECRFYRRADSWLDLGTSYAQLCFADGALVSKDRIS